MNINRKNRAPRKSQNSSQSSNQVEDDKSDTSSILCTDNSPKIIPISKMPQQLQERNIIINISDTQYPIIEEIAEDLQWVVQNEEGDGNWDIWWTDREINPDVLFRMHLHQKVNYFPGIYVLARKNLLGMNLMAMKKKFMDEYNFFPETWVLPLEYPNFMRYYDSCPKGKARTYIVKPQALSQGRGIFLTRSIQQLTNGHKYVVQRYIKNPFLIDKLKFDLRIYVLLGGTDPLRLYIFEEGLTRFATKPYQEPDQQNLQNSYIHLTNYSLNKNNADYIYNESAQKMDVGHKRSLTSTYLYLEQKGYDVNKLKKQINDAIIKTIIAGLPPISHQYNYCQPEDFQGNMCFHILGFDVMITQHLKPYIIEINHTPSFQTSTPLDQKIKKSLITDTLKLMRTTERNKRNLFEKGKEILKKRVQTGKREIFKGVERKTILEKAQKQRDMQEEGLLGGFTKIYPFQTEQQNKKYQQMIAYANIVHKDTQQARKKLIRDEQSNDKAQKMQEKFQNKNCKKNGKQFKSQIETKNTKNTKCQIYKKQKKPLEIKIKEQLNGVLNKNKKSKMSNALKKDCKIIGTNLNMIEEISEEFVEISKKQKNDRYPQRATLNGCGFRMKKKKTIHSVSQQKQQCQNFRNIVQNIGPYHTHSVQLEQKTFAILSKIANKKKKLGSQKTIQKEVKQKKSQKQGAFVRPKIYQITQSHLQNFNINFKQILKKDDKEFYNNFVVEPQKPNIFQNLKTRNHQNRNSLI